MDLKEAIDILKNQICDYVIPSFCNDCENKTECLDDCNYILAIYTVIQELDNLQKENEGIKARIDKYIQGGNETLRLEHEETLKYYHENYISKDKIREKIELLEMETTITIAGMRSSGKTASVFKKLGKLEALQDLLKEE